MKYNFPVDCYYDRKNHLWVRPGQTGGRVLTGMDALGLESLGDLAYIVLPAVGAHVVRGQACGTLEAAKMTGDLIAPVTGTVVARNEAVVRDPSLVNRDNYGQGWLVAIEPEAWSGEQTELVHGPEQETWAAGEIERYVQQGWIHGA